MECYRCLRHHKGALWNATDVHVHTSNVSWQQPIDFEPTEHTFLTRATSLFPARLIFPLSLLALQKAGGSLGMRPDQGNRASISKPFWGLKSQAGDKEGIAAIYLVSSNVRDHVLPLFLIYGVWSIEVTYCLHTPPCHQCCVTLGDRGCQGHSGDAS